jgi:hypothetical protein
MEFHRGFQTCAAHGWCKYIGLEIGEVVKDAVYFKSTPVAPFSTH